jgi:hypothetical protein
MLNFDLTLEQGFMAKIQNITFVNNPAFTYTLRVKITEISTGIVTYFNGLTLADFPKTFQLSRGSFDVELQLLYDYGRKIDTNFPIGLISPPDYTPYQGFAVTLPFDQSWGLIPNPNPIYEYTSTLSNGTLIEFIDAFGNLLGTYALFNSVWEVQIQRQQLAFAGTFPAGATNMKYTFADFPLVYPLGETAVSNVTVVDNTIYPRYAPVINISPANSPRFVVKEISGCCEMKNPNNTLFAEFFDRDSASFYGYKQKYNECDEIMIMFKSNYLSHKLEIWKSDQLLDTINCTERTLQAPMQPLAQGVKFFETKIHWKGFGCGCYQLKIKGKDRGTAIGELFPTIPDSFVAISEPIQVGHFEKDFVLIEYTNNTNNYHLLYSENPAFEKLKHILRVEGWFGFEAEIEIDNEVYRTAAGKVEKLYESLAKKLNFRTGRLPNYMHEKLIIAFSHDNVVINGVNVTADGKYNTKNEKNKLQLRTGEIQLTDNSFFFENEP